MRRSKNVESPLGNGVIPIQVTLTWQTLLSAAAVVGAFVALVAYLRKLFGWFERQEKQDKEINEIKKEQAIIVEGLLACLKGLQELHCDGPVTEGITKIEHHINSKAHT